MSSHIKLTICILLCLGVGWMGGLFTETSLKTWYPTLVKPTWTPPNWMFPVVWTLLFILMGISLWLVWTSKSNYEPKFWAYFAFGLQLFFNFIWSILFFYLESPFYALIDVFLLWATIMGTFIIFWGYSKAAALLLIPYWLWVTFAFALNWFISINNNI